MTKRHGFTLIELLITIAVLAIISAVALPNFSSIQNKAKESNVKQLLYSVQLAVESYRVGSGGYPAGTDLPFSKLLTTLKTSGDFTGNPPNPFTNTSYTDKDTLGQITYTFDGDSQVYTLTAFGAKADTSVLTLQNI